MTSKDGNKQMHTGSLGSKSPTSTMHSRLDMRAPCFCNVLCHELDRLKSLQDKHDCELAMNIGADWIRKRKRVYRTEEEAKTARLEALKTKKCTLK